MVRSEFNRSQALVFFPRQFFARALLSEPLEKATTAAVAEAALLMLNIENDFPFCKSENNFPYLSQSWLHV